MTGRTVLVRKVKNTDFLQESSKKTCVQICLYCNLA